MNETYVIDPDNLSIEVIEEILTEEKKIQLSENTKMKIIECRDYLDKKMQNQVDSIYGINTGCGSFCNIKINKNDFCKLQKNFITSHACGTGKIVDTEIVKIMLLLKIKSLSFGKSGVQLITVERLIDFYNNDILPVVYELGSLGASGDLSPLSHLCMPLIGEGEVFYKGLRQRSHTVLKNFGWKPITLKSKEGLALINGTQFMSAYGCYVIIKTKKFSYLADVIGAISLEGFDGSIEPFNKLIHIARPHKGQIDTANFITKILKGSELIAKSKKNVQDPYSFRCIPQVHGATKDALNYVDRVFNTEINSVTDNPTIFYEEDLILSGGNFHGQPLALALDFISIALAELGSISERRTFQLISGLRNLPPFLVSNPGINSGLMIPQYTAASAVSQNKQLATPASVDSIVSNNGQEDHVSMGANAATKTLRIINNLERILAIELMTAAQALEFRRPAKSSEFIETFLRSYRIYVPFVETDRILHYDIVKSISFFKKFYQNQYIINGNNHTYY